MEVITPFDGLEDVTSYIQGDFRFDGLLSCSGACLSRTSNLKWFQV